MRDRDQRPSAPGCLRDGIREMLPSSHATASPPSRAIRRPVPPPGVTARLRARICAQPRRCPTASRAAPRHAAALGAETRLPQDGLFGGPSRRRRRRSQAPGCTQSPDPARVQPRRSAPLPLLRRPSLSASILRTMAFSRRCCSSGLSRAYSSASSCGRENRASNRRLARLGSARPDPRPRRPPALRAAPPGRNQRGAARTPRPAPPGPGPGPAPAAAAAASRRRGGERAEGRGKGRGGGPQRRLRAARAGRAACSPSCPALPLCRAGGGVPPGAPLQTAGSSERPGPKWCAAVHLRRDGSVRTEQSSPVRDGDPNRRCGARVAL